MGDEVIVIEKARGLVGDAKLWPSVRDFLWNFVPQVHASWLESLWPEALGASREGESTPSLVSGLMSSPRIGKFILSSLGVKPCFHDFPADDWSRLALLDGATLESIAKWLGAIACAEDLRRVTDGATVRALKSALPGLYPDVFGYTAYFAGLDFAAKDAPDAKMPERVVAVGLGLLFALMGACPAPVVERLKLKLPKGLCGLCVPCGEKGGGSATGVAVKKLLKLKFPEAYSLCCS